MGFKIFRAEVLLIILILIGVFFRFYHLNVPLNGDEAIIGISAIKFHEQSFSAGKDFVLEHPPLGKWMVGLPSIFIKADYEPLKFLGKDMFVWSYIAYDALAKNYIAMRIVEAIGGVISLFLIFLITKNLFGPKVALWSTVVSALSFELVGYSRVIFMESPMIVFTLLTLLLYINYLKSSNKKRSLYFGLFFVSLIITLLTRHIQPLFLLPIFVISQFLLNRNLKSNIYFLILIGMSYYIVFHMIFPQDILGYGESRYGFSNILGFFSFRFFSVIGHLIFRNSFLFLTSLIAFGYITYRTSWKQNIKAMRGDVKSVLAVFFVVSFLAFSFLSFTLPRHYVFMFIPLYIISGYVLDKISGNKILGSLIILLALVNVAQLAQHFPEFLTYTNFGLSGFQSFPSTEFKQFQARLDKLNAENITSLMTNDVNLLIFFNGEKLALIPSIETKCNNQTINSLDVKDFTIVYIPPAKNFTLMNDQFICPLLREKLYKENVKVLQS